MIGKVVEVVADNLWPRADRQNVAARALDQRCLPARRDALKGRFHRFKIEKRLVDIKRRSAGEQPYCLDSCYCAPGPEFVSLSLLVLAPVAVSGLFGAIAADRHAAPSSRPPACTVGEHQRAAMSLTGFDVGEIFLARELRQGFADQQQQRFRRSPAPHHSQFQAIAAAMAMP